MRGYSSSMVGIVTLLSNCFASNSAAWNDTSSNSSGNTWPAQQPPNGSWLGWGADVYNNHWTSRDTIIDVDNVGSLELTCSMFYDPGVSATPYVEGNLVYYPTWSGLMVALNYQTCEVTWQTNITDAIYQFGPVTYSNITGLASRTTPAVDGNTMYIGTLANALLMALDKTTGAVIDMIQVSNHSVAILTMSPTVWNGIVYIGVSSNEEGAAALIPDYPCCSFIGSMNAFAFNNKTLQLHWTQNMVPPNSNFSGAAIWGSQPSIDQQRNQVFIATGNTYTIPEEYQACQNQTQNITVIQQGNTTDPCTPEDVYQESVLAFDLDTGFINWARQLSPIEAWNIACILKTVNPNACPPNPGQDSDFGMAPVFVPGSANTPNGLDMVVVGQKNGILWALTAQAGQVLWSLPTGPDGDQGGLIWGVAVDDAAVYYTVSNSNRDSFALAAPSNIDISTSAYGAASLATGANIWQVPAPNVSDSVGVPSIANEVVLFSTTGPSQPLGSVTGPGSLVPLNKRTGEILKVYSLDSFMQGNIAIVNEYVMFGTGYQSVRGTGYNGTFQVWKVGG